jgi:hypothetical protein
MTVLCSIVQALMLMVFKTWHYNHLRYGSVFTKSILNAFRGLRTIDALHETYVYSPLNNRDLLLTIQKVNVAPVMKFKHFGVRVRRASRCDRDHPHSL